QSLQRALHTPKGSARMAGALRLGELVHGIESRIEAALDSGQTSTGLFDALVSQADRLSADGERLRAEIAAPVGRQAQPRVPAGVPAAMLRVRADTLDHVINEAGEVAIARSRAEAELRAIRQSLADLAEGVARLRTQLREVEVQADSQVQS